MTLPSGLSPLPVEAWIELVGLGYYTSIGATDKT